MAEIQFHTAQVKAAGHFCAHKYAPPHLLYSVPHSHQPHPLTNVRLILRYYQLKRIEHLLLSTVYAYGPLTMSEHRRQLIHDQAEENLKIKLLGIPARIGYGNINMFDLYAGRVPAPSVKIPRDLDLTFVFNHFDEFKRTNFTAWKGHKHDINRAIFYYQMDKMHSLSHYHDQVRYNLITMVFISMSPATFKIHCHPALVEDPAFVSEFILAWFHSLYWDGSATYDHAENWLRIWADGPLDLIRFTRSQRNRLLRACTDAREMIPPHEWAPWDFWTGPPSEEEFKKHGLRLALRFLLDERSSAHIRETKAEAEEAFKDGGLEGALAGTNLDKKSFTMDLADVDFDQSLISALLKAPDRKIRAQTPEVDKSTFWMPADTAEEMILGHLEKTQELLANFTL